MTVGITQIRSDRPLSTLESITLLAQRLKETKQADLEQKVAALTTYGGSRGYADSILKVHEILHLHELSEFEF